MTGCAFSWNPIEVAFSKVKYPLRKIRTLEVLFEATSPTLSRAMVGNVDGFLSLRLRDAMGALAYENRSRRERGYGCYRLS